MKRYTKQYKDFLNESSLETTWITPENLIDYLDQVLDLDLDVEPSNATLFQWLQMLDYYILGEIINQLFSKRDRVRISLNIIKNVDVIKSETIYDRLKMPPKDSRFLKGIRSCDAYLKGKIGDDDLKPVIITGLSSNIDYIVNHAIRADVAEVANGVVCAIGADTLDVSAACEQIFLEELEKFDWSRVEKEIRGHNIFGE